MNVNLYKRLFFNTAFLNPVLDGPFLSGAAHGEGGGRRGCQKSSLPKICHTYPTATKLGTAILVQSRSKKYMNHMTHPLSSADISISSLQISKFC